MRKLKMAVLSFIMIATCQGSILHAQEENGDLAGFEGVDIITEDTYVPVDRDIYKTMENVPMGGNEAGYRFARASAPRWETKDGIKNFYDGTGKLVYKTDTKKIVDVSEHRGKINWEKAKADGIDGAIIRVGYGHLGEDDYFRYNVNECNRLGIPYGIYLYSYAYDANFAYSEAEGTAEMLSKVSLNLSYPIYYDIEAFSAWNDHGTTRKHPTTPAQYEKIIGTYINRMNQLGYEGRVHVYSYRYYLQTALKSAKILPYVSWIAEYNSTLAYENTYYSGDEGWQYTSSGKVNGIAGDTDISCFSDQMYHTNISSSIPSEVSTKLNSMGVKFTGGYVSGFKLGSDLTTVVNSLKSLGTVNVYSAKGAMLSGGKIATGQRISIVPNNKGINDTYNMLVVMRGDVNGDGRISTIDYSLIKNDILKISKLSGAQFMAGDVNKSGTISTIDYSLVKNDILNLAKITQ